MIRQACPVGRHAHKNAMNLRVRKDTRGSIPTEAVLHHVQAHFSLVLVPAKVSVDRPRRLRLAVGLVFRGRRRSLGLAAFWRYVARITHLGAGRLL